MLVYNLQIPHKNELPISIFRWADLNAEFCLPFRILVFGLPVLDEVERGEEKGEEKSNKSEGFQHGFEKILNNYN